jgi:hypothetical protein
MVNSPMRHRPLRRPAVGRGFEKYEGACLFVLASIQEPRLFSPCLEQIDDVIQIESILDAIGAQRIRGRSQTRRHR